MSKIDFQLFANDFEGIDKDIQDEILGSNEPKTEANETEKPNADADSENKTVEAEKVNDGEKSKEENNSEEVKTEENGNIPYSRFKEVNEKRKSAEAEVLTLKKKLEELKTTPKLAEEKKVDTTGFVADGFSQEQMEKITAYAIKKVKEKSKLSDEDVDAIRYGDDQNKTMAFNASVQSEINKAVSDLQNYRAEQVKFTQMCDETTKEFGELNDKLMAYPDKDERFKFLTETAFEKLPQRKQVILNDAFLRLQKKKGTFADIELVKEYFDKANEEWEKSHDQKPAATAAEKFEKAKGLPKAANINGGASTDQNYSIDDLRAILESGDSKKWDALPEKVRQGILEGTLRL